MPTQFVTQRGSSMTHPCECAPIGPRDCSGVQTIGRKPRLGHARAQRPRGGSGWLASSTSPASRRLATERYKGGGIRHRRGQRLDDLVRDVGRALRGDLRRQYGSERDRTRQRPLPAWRRVAGDPGEKAYAFRPRVRRLARFHGSWSLWSAKARGGLSPSGVGANLPISGKGVSTAACFFNGAQTIRRPARRRRLSPRMNGCA